MSLLGKVLAFLNVLAAIGFVLVAALDYDKRRVWAYAVFRDDLLIHGLPVDDKQTDDQGRPVVDRIGDQTKQQLFQQAGGSPVTTQVAEVEKVEGKVKGAVGSAGGVPQQLFVLARVLLPFAETNAQRERLLADLTWLGTPQAQNLFKQRFQTAHDEAVQKFRQPPPAGRPRPTFDDLFGDSLRAQGNEPFGPLETYFVKAVTSGAQKPFEQAFNDALEAQRADLEGQLNALFTAAKTGQRTTPEGTKRMALSEWRLVIARVLFNMIDAVPEQGAAAPAQPAGFAEAPAFRRFITVVGLTTAVQTVGAQTQELVRIASELSAERGRDMARFAKDQTALLEQVKERARQVAADNAEMLRRQEQLRKQETLVKRREAEVASYRTDLDEKRRETAAHLKDLRTMSQVLFQERIKLRDATSENQKLEKTVRQLEEGR